MECNHLTNVTSYPETIFRETQRCSIEGRARRGGTWPLVVSTSYKQTHIFVRNARDWSSRITTVAWRSKTCGLLLITCYGWFIRSTRAAGRYVSSSIVFVDVSDITLPYIIRPQLILSGTDSMAVYSHSPGCPTSK